MTRIEIYLDEKIKSRGYSGSKVYEDNEVYVTIGSTNEGDSRLSRLHRMSVSFTGLDVVLYGGPNEVANWYNWWNTVTWDQKGTCDALNAHCWSLLMSSLTAKHLQTLMANQYEAGRVNGRNAFRNEFHAMMRQE